MTAKSARADFLHFFRSWISNPLRVAAIAPSGDSLARIMTSEIAALDGPIIELGPGTGVFTRALLARGVSEADLTLIEYGPEFITSLQARFPTARVLQMDAAHLAHADIFEGEPVGAVVSGLPLLSMPPRKIASIMAGAFAYMRPGGAVYQFTYGPRCPVPRPILDRLDLKAVRIGGTVRNLPPASVYRISRSKPLELSRERIGYRESETDIDDVAAFSNETGG
ncbi:methyltransferase domain-containing protein [Rhizobium ruizarguesonis]|jgi:phospholipid N-methyltransferase|uniref:Methyltransferase domain-containing protein n=1 Tax=Rhizobium ruizarguesonis TaxID=2081791 RepID=A0AAE8QAH6_9HYPH|nr:methyltransferase domain-containing protein [Rhizobium ruizarguesonis]MBY5856008.1 methyltransferase domain-containing protein [Rhizobium leguminosarum]NKJ76248.1 methyltransferase domain-containing protein [Rhizobium leguminosarum bv. viciae]QIO45242.1 methyltransferase domain-containing protein [Rhizobium leguminosarum bv. trifolii]MBC2801992.1 methyltransferase domain-containing protein [Rhizobium ruizarguesonis]MBY5891584.1 methyltransferase domain-containing protein [Rhizobium legumino